MSANIEGDGGPSVEEARAALEELLRLMHFEAEISLREDGERIRFDLSGPDTGLLVDKKGTALEALQLILNKVVNKKPVGRRPIVLDTDSYRDRRGQALEVLAQELAEKARTSRRSLAIMGMNAADRRVLHVALAEVPGVTTRSEGEGASRRMLVEPEAETDRQR